jgi:hypothetical protein
MGISQWKGRVNPQWTGSHTTRGGSGQFDSTLHIGMDGCSSAVCSKSQIAAYVTFCAKLMGRIQQKMAPLTDNGRVDMTDLNMLKSTLNHVLY